MVVRVLDGVSADVLFECVELDGDAERWINGVADATEKVLDEGVMGGGTSSVRARCVGGARYVLRESREDDEGSGELTDGTGGGLREDEVGEVGEVMAE